MTPRGILGPMRRDLACAATFALLTACAGDDAVTTDTASTTEATTTDGTTTTTTTATTTATTTGPTTTDPSGTESATGTTSDETTTGNIMCRQITSSPTLNTICFSAD